MPEDPKDKTTKQDPPGEPGDETATKVRELIGSIREEIGQNHTDLQAKLDAIETQRESEKTDMGKLREELAGIKAQADERESTIREIERRNNLRLEADPAQQREKALEMVGMIARRELARGLRVDVPARFAHERELVTGYMREFAERANPFVRATLDEQTAAGGYFMPTVLVLDIYDTLEQISALLGAVDFQTGVPTKGAYPTLTGRPTLQPKRASSDTTMTQSDPAFSQFTWDTDEAYIYFPVDNWMFELSPIQLGTRMVALARDSYMVGLVDWLISADGTAIYNSNTGILEDTVKVVRMAGTTFESLTNGDLRKLMRGVLVRGRANGVFLAGPYAVDVLEEIGREGKVPILRERQDSYFVKGKPLVEDEGMPDETASAADAAFLGFGDPKTWGVVLAGAGLKIASDTSYLFGNNQTAFRATGHVDIVRKPGNTWALLKTKAS